MTAVYNKKDNNESNKDNNSKDSKNNNNKNSKSEKAIKTEDNDPISNDNKYITIYYTVLVYSWLYIIIKEENYAYYKKCIIY